jgi:hypothetical protein
VTIQLPTRMSAVDLELWLKSMGRRVPCADVQGAPPGECSGCETDDHHPAVCVVDVAVATEPAEPQPGGWSDALCIAGLSAYLADVQGAEGFVGASIEVIQP